MLLSEGNDNTKKVEKEGSLTYIFFPCNQCEYKLENETNLSGHIKIRHEEQKCKVCQLMLPTIFELLKNVIEEHKIKYFTSSLSSVENEESEGDNSDEGNTGFLAKFDDDGNLKG